MKSSMVSMVSTRPQAEGYLPSPSLVSAWTQTTTRTVVPRTVVTHNSNRGRTRESTGEGPA